MATATGSLPRQVERPSGEDRWFTVSMLGAVGLLAFIGGGFVVLHGLWPGKVMTNAYEGANALYWLNKAHESPLKTDQWFPARRSERGVTVHDAARALNGYTLYTSGHDSSAQLIDMNGDVVHEWRRRFSEIWDETSAVKSPAPDEFMYWRKAKLLPDGALLAVYENVDTPWGYGLAKVDRDSNVVWKYLEQVHHDVEVGQDGRIYTLTHTINHEPYENYPHLTPRIDDYVVVLSPDGEELRKISVLEAIMNSPFVELLQRIKPGFPGDLLHTNAIEPIEGELARGLPFDAEGTVLISLRDIDTLAAVNLDSGEVVWVLRGPWLAQHDPDVLPGGRILLFDNQGNFEPDNRSRILEVDAETGAIVWSYVGDDAHPFDSTIRAAQQRLPNGNTLITESSGARLLEVTPGGEIVWEYMNPVREQHPGDPAVELAPVVSWAERFAPGDLPSGLLSR